MKQPTQSEQNELTIDEMLAFLESLDYDDVPTMNAIRAILEQHRDRQEEMKCYERTND